MNAEQILVMNFAAMASLLSVVRRWANGRNLHRSLSGHVAES